MRRRELLTAGAGALAGLAGFPFGWAAAADKPKRRILYFTRCVGYEHEMVARQGAELAFSEKTLTELGKRVGLEVTCTKDGSVFDQDLDRFDCIAFYTSSGDLTQPNKHGDPPMTLKGKQRMLDAIAAGKPFVGFHAATCSFRFRQIDPYITMLGAQFGSHGAQQVATMKVVSPKFPGLAGCGESFALKDEWYAMYRYNPEMHVILVQETEGMTGDQYQRPPYPATWAKMHGRGRVFYTSMGHREDVWTNPTFQGIVLGGLSWALGDVDADIAPNFRQVTPDAPTA